MRILLVGVKWIAQWTESCERALRRLGHDVEVFYYNPPWLEAATWLRLGLRRRIPFRPMRDHRLLAEPTLEALGRGLLNAVLRRSALRYRPDLILALKGEFVRPTLLAELRSRLDCRLVTWWVDDPFRYPAIVAAARVYDGFFVFDRSYLAPLFESGVVEAHFLPCACDPELYSDVNSSGPGVDGFQPDLALVASCHPERAELVGHLLGYSLAIWGPGWGDFQRQTGTSLPPGVWRAEWVTPRQAAAIYRSAKINLNLHHAQTRAAGLNTRTFEVLAAGGFQLVDHVDGMEELLQPGEDIVAFRDYGEIPDLVESYLARPEDRARVAERGRGRVLREHTYDHRMTELLSRLG